MVRYSRRSLPSILCGAVSNDVESNQNQIYAAWLSPVNYRMYGISRILCTKPPDLKPMATKPFLDQVFATTSIEQSRQLYDQWAASYDSDMAAHDFTGPRLVAERVAKYLKDVPASKAQIVDAGCGSGAVGLELNKLGYQMVDGLDISQGMLDIARKLAVYRELKIADLTKKLEARDGAYDALVCCGVFTYGHLEKDLLDDFVRVVRSGGILVATVLETYWDHKDFAGLVERMTKSKTVEILENDVHDYRKDAGGGRVLVLRKS